MRRKIKAVIDKLERNGVMVTVDAVVANLDWRSFTMDEIERMASSRMRRLVAEVMKSLHYVITDEITRERRDFWGATTEQLKVQWQIERDNRQSVEAHEKARGMVVELLDAKEREYGYRFVPAMVYEDVRRIYAMHGLEAPK
jgi:hypothetical protein